MAREDTVRDLFGVAGKRFVVLGGGQGMGEATARLLAGLGANLALVDVELARAERVAGELRDMGVEASPFTCDVTDDEALAATLQRIEHEAGPLDGLATVIGMAAWSSILDMSGETWDLDHRRNLRYFFVAGREMAKLLRARSAPGTMVAVASIDGIGSSPGHAAYGAAKAGLVNLVKTMAVEWSALGIRVNAVAPGGIVTPRLPVTDAAAERKSMTLLPMKRRGTVQDIAKAAVYLLSDMSPYVTGHTLLVDGGYLATTIFGERQAAMVGAAADPGTAF